MHSYRAAFVVTLLLAAPFAAGCSTTKAVASNVDDASITAHVKTVLLNDTQLNATKINVNTSNGVVVMSGAVASKADEQRAIQLARQVSGVREVRSELQVSSQPTTLRL